MKNHKISHLTQHFLLRWSLAHPAPPQPPRAQHAARGPGLRAAGRRHGEPRDVVLRRRAAAVAVPLRGGGAAGGAAAVHRTTLEWQDEAMGNWGLPGGISGKSQGYTSRIRHHECHLLNLWYTNCSLMNDTVNWVQKMRMISPIHGSFGGEHDGQPWDLGVSCVQANPYALARLDGVCVYIYTHHVMSCHVMSCICKCMYNIYIYIDTYTQ